MFNKKSILLLTLTILLISITACKPTAAQEPTIDPNMIYTSAAETVAVQLTDNAQAGPQATATQPPAPIATTEIAETSAEVNVEVLPTNTNMPMPTITNTMAPVHDKANLVSQNPTDNSTIGSQTEFTVTWEIQNTGETTWTTDYQIRYFSGTRIGSDLPTSYNLTQSVTPNNSISISVAMRTGKESGQFTSNWVLTNAEGQNFYPVYVKINVEPATATPTLTESPTVEPSATPTITETAESTPDSGG